MLWIGGNHLIHALRRNVNVTILMLNNQIYGLTKGQYSPTSERGKVTKFHADRAPSTSPFNPLSVAIGAEATFVGRAIDTDKKELTEVLLVPPPHIAAPRSWRCCRTATSTTTAPSTSFAMAQGEPPLPAGGRRGALGRRGVRIDADGSAEIVDASAGGLLVHDPGHVEPSVAFALARLTFGTVGAVPLGVFRDVERPVYDEEVAAQISAAKEQRGEGDLAALLVAGDTWEIG